MLRTLLRLAGAGLLAATAAIHLDLYLTGYRSIPTIGWLFLLQVIAAFALAAAVLAIAFARGDGLVPWLVAAAGAGFAVATLGGYLLSLWIGLFGFREVRTAAGTVAGVIEVAAFAALAVVAVALVPRAGRVGSAAGADAAAGPAGDARPGRGLAGMRAALAAAGAVSLIALAVLGGSVAAATSAPAGGYGRSQRRPGQEPRLAIPLPHRPVHMAHDAPRRRDGSPADGSSADLREHRRMAHRRPRRMVHAALVPVREACH
jgi:hypothetical protein